MNKNILSLLFVAVLIGGISAANASDQKSVAPMGETPKHAIVNVSEKLGKKLNLTAEQKAQAKQIREDGRAKIKPLMEQMRETRRQVDAIRQENMQAFEKILTAEQKAQFEQIKAEKKMHRAKKMHKKDGKKFEKEAPVAK